MIATERGDHVTARNPGYAARETEEPMPTRRALFLGALVAFSAVFALARPEKSEPLDVTYYYLPG
jgi:hypothetical protein